MRRNILSLLSAAALTFGLLAAPNAWAQMRGGSTMGGQQPGGMNQQGTQPNGTQPNGMQPNGNMGMQNPQNSAQAAFVANVKRNSKVETDLSKMALKNSSNDGVKQFAQQVIQENRKNEMTLTTADNTNSSGMPFMADVPDQTRKAEKQMKKTTGTPFDQMYLAQMDGYVKNDQKLVTDASANMNSADMGALTMQMRNMADARTKQIGQLAQSENFKIQ